MKSKFSSSHWQTNEIEFVKMTQILIKRDEASSTERRVLIGGFGVA